MLETGGKAGEMGREGGVGAGLGGRWRGEVGSYQSVRKLWIITERHRHCDSPGGL